MVAVGGPRTEPVVLRRQRVELAADYPGSLQPFHAAEGLELKRATTLIQRSTDAAHTLASRAMRAAVADLRREGHEVVACGLLLASGRPLPALAQILASHALIHAADGELFREALLDTARACGLEVTAVKERELIDRGAERLRVAPAELKSRLDGMGRSLGPPWRQDEKLATLAAWLSLAARKRGERKR
jgi:Asp-tRNA(Asn)/Glu-tRNA(Gln) amidotransferase A subunit family amidase